MSRSRIDVRLEFLRQNAAAHQAQDLRLRLSGRGRGQHPDPEGMPAPGIQEAQGGQTVEPGVGHSLDELGAAGLGLGPETFHLGGSSAQVDGIAGKDEVQLALHGFEQLAADLWGERLEGRGVHVAYRLIRLPLASSATAAVRSASSQRPTLLPPKCTARPQSALRLAAGIKRTAASPCLRPPRPHQRPRDATPDPTVPDSPAMHSGSGGLGLR